MKLLERAKKVETGNKTHLDYNIELVELTVAMLNGEVSLAQAAKASGIKRNNYYFRMGTLLRAAVRRGDVTVKFTP